MTLGGSDAVSGILIWTRANAKAHTPNMMKSRMILQLFHAYTEPPHCRASKRQTVDGMKNKVPRGSRRRICSLTEAGALGFEGTLRKKKRRMKATTPTGRLM